MTSGRKHFLAGVLLIFATYFYFLIFAQFAFLELKGGKQFGTTSAAHDGRHGPWRPGWEFCCANYTEAKAPYTATPGVSRCVL